MLERYHPNGTTMQRGLIRTNVQVEPCTRSQLPRAFAFVHREEPLVERHPRLERWLELHEREFCSPTRPVWLAADGEKVFGMLIGRMDKSKDAKLSVLYVVEGFNRHRIMSDLLERLERVAADLGKRTVHLHVFEDEIEDISFFEEHGYNTVPKEMLHKTELPLKVRYLMVKRPLNR